ncbi:glycosyl hydrolase [Streptococcus dentiloxodontae]
MIAAENHLFPFFWQHGEEEEVLIDYIDKIYQSGIEGVCIESRPHPDFAGDRWWHDLKIIIRECRKREMTVWILDDSHFPTGFANGKIKEVFPELRKQYLAMRRYDAAGPFKGARIDASLLKGRPWETKQAEIIDLVGVYLAQRASDCNQPGDPIKAQSIIDITSQFKHDTVFLDIPKGNWSVFVIFSTHDGGEEATEDYLNPLDSKATQVLVDEVYEKHFSQLGEYFGSTITAFFSDEPRFGNEKGTQSSIGKPDMVLPWRSSLEKDCHFDKSFLPLLWVPSDKEEHREVRYDYMDVITREYNRNFVKVLADWCEAHGVDYLGHNIEDNGSHARLGYGAGHYFRGQEAQHYSGIDVIGGQIVPGMPYHHDAYQTGGSDGQFYHYALAKLGASAADLYPHKKGRAMCEAFGAYGWNEGLKTMKWIADHLIVRGINTLVPHAFSPKPFPDFDCPPHFYARGNNPQFRYMDKLNLYLNRLLSIFSGGRHIAPIALFYPAEFEWTGDYMPVEIPARVLTRAQIDFDIVSNDLLKTAEMEDGKLLINNHCFEALVIPYAEYIPKALLKVINAIIDAGGKVLFINQLPINKAALKQSLSVVSLEELPNELASSAEVKAETASPDLVYYHYRKDHKDYWLFFNESISETISAKLTFTGMPPHIYAYDAYEDTCLNVTDSQLQLAPYETIVWVFSDDGLYSKKIKNRLGGKAQAQAVLAYGKLKSTTYSFDFQRVSPCQSGLCYDGKERIQAEWTISYASALAYPDFTPIAISKEIRPINSLPDFDRKAGTASYSAVIDIKEPGSVVGIDLGAAYETAEVFINGLSLGIKIAPPYIFETANGFTEGKNELRIEVTNTLGTEFRGGLNQYLLVEPFGLTEEIKLLKKKD